MLPTPLMRASSSLNEFRLPCVPQSTHTTRHARHTHTDTRLVLAYAVAGNVGRAAPGRSCSAPISWTCRPPPPWRSLPSTWRSWSPP
jgi:hypothetical protein